MVQICALASGSNGNCYYVGNEEEAILVDMGISNAQFIKRMNESGLSIHKIKAVFISHEHTDHVRGLRIACDKHHIKAYTTYKTLEKIKDDYRPAHISLFNAGETIHMSSIKVHSFKKQHDAIDPVSFRIEINGINVAVITDLGIADNQIKDQLKLCNAAFLESNYDPHILETGMYPLFLKRRITSEIGHLSNQQAFELVKSLNGSPLKTIFLSHISKDNNKPELAMEAFKSLESKICIEPASRESTSRVVEILKQ